MSFRSPVTALNVSVAVSALGWYNVHDYGAQGDGITDDTVAVQKAINACQSAGGGVVHFPAGTYVLSSGLTVYSRIFLVGNGQDVSTLRQTNTAAHGVHGTDVTHFGVSSLTVSGPSSGTGSGIVLGLSANPSSSYLTFSDVTVTNFGVDGLDIDTAIVSTFAGVISQTNGRHGFNVHSATSSTSCDFSSCYANGNGQVGYNLVKLFYSELGSCASDTNGIGYLLTSCGAVMLNGCGTEADVPKNGQDGTGFKLDSCEACTLVSCSVSANTTVGIWLATAGDAGVLMSCQELSATSATAFIKVDANVSCTVYSHAHITPNSLAGTVTQIDQPAGQFNLPGYLFVGTSIEAANNITADNGNMVIATAGKGLQVKEGTNAKMGFATLNGTTAVTVANTAVNNASRILLTVNTPGGTPGSPYVSARNAGSSFSVKSTSSTDTSQVAYLIVDPA